MTSRPMIIRGRCRHAVAMLCGLFCSAIAWAQEPQAPPSGPIPVLPPVTVTAPPPVASSSEQIIPGRDFELRPEGRPADDATGGGAVTVTGGRTGMGPLG